MAEKIRLELGDAPRLLEPGPLALVTSLHRSAHNVMTAAWLMPASLNPPLIAIAVHPGRLSHEYIGKSEFFTLNIPTVDLLAAVHRCGMESGREFDKFERAGLTPSDALEIDVPLVAECVAHIECGVVGRASFGDHDLFVGSPLAVSALDEAFDGHWRVDVDAGRILHHLRADAYAGLGHSYRARYDEER